MVGPVLLGWALRKIHICTKALEGHFHVKFHLKIHLKERVEFRTPVRGNGSPQRPTSCKISHEISSEISYGNGLPELSYIRPLP